MSKNTSSSIAGPSIIIAIITLVPYSSIVASAQVASNEKSIGVRVGGNSYPITYHFTNGGTIDSIAIDKLSKNLFANQSNVTFGWQFGNKDS